MAAGSTQFRCRSVPRSAGRWSANGSSKYEESAAVAANFFVANVILIPSTVFILYQRSELRFGDQFVAIVLMIVGTIIAASVGRVFYQIALTATGGDNGFVTMFLNLVPALTALISLALSWWIADLHFAADPWFFAGSALDRGVAAAVFAEGLAATAPAGVRAAPVVRVSIIEGRRIPSPLVGEG